MPDFKIPASLQMRYHGRMKKRQLHTRLGSHAVSQIITRFNDREIDLGEAMNLL